MRSATPTKLIVDEDPLTNPSTGDRINPKSAAEIAELAEELGVSAYHLSKVVNRVGPMLGDIYHALGLRPWDIPKNRRRNRL